MKKIDMSEKAIEARLWQVDQLHALSVELLKAGLLRQEELKTKGKASEKQIRRFKKYLA
ncbi:MAG: hypothetical protein ACK4S4_07885 [Pyrinomonadaceae bacterium]